MSNNKEKLENNREIKDKELNLELKKIIKEKDIILRLKTNENETLIDKLSICVNNLGMLKEENSKLTKEIEDLDVKYYVK